VIGVSLQLWDYSQSDENKFGTCCSPDDLYDARRVAEQLGIPFYVVNAQEEFRTHVVDGFTASYARGETPNPCVHCNDTVKFDRLLSLTDGLGADMLVTGHYAQRATLEDGSHVLRKARDTGKDQTYFLFKLDQARLARVMFPLGGMTKQEVRELAMARGLPTASKHDSQELCFVPDNDYGSFLEGEGLEPVLGDIVDLEGRIRGRHRGLHHYTIGQRKGLGIGASAPLYVLALDRAHNRVIVGSEQDLFQHGLIARGITWVGGEAPEDLAMAARIRYRANEVPVLLQQLEGDRYRVLFVEPQRAVAPGQAIVFYRDDLVLGGGWIEGALMEVQLRNGAYEV